MVTMEKIHLAYHQTSKNKRSSKDYLKFDEWKYKNLLKIYHDLKKNKYEVSPHKTFKIVDPKPRTITALNYRDRIVQRLIYNEIQPIFDKTFHNNSYACRKNKGTHKASKITQSYIRKKGIYYFLKTDYSKYFKSINRKILWNCIERKIGCKKTINLIEKFIPRNGFGINIGELLSQLFANVYGHLIDEYIRHELKQKYYLRYMDDIVIFGNNISELKVIKSKLESYSKKLGLKFSKWHISNTNKGVNFVGYRIFDNYKLIRKSSIKNAKRKIKQLNDEDLKLFLNSWFGHISHANSFNLKNKLLKIRNQ